MSVKLIFRTIMTSMVLLLLASCTKENITAETQTNVNTVTTRSNSAFCFEGTWHNEVLGYWMDNSYEEPVPDPATALQIIAPFLSDNGLEISGDQEDQLIQQMTPMYEFVMNTPVSEDMMNQYLDQLLAQLAAESAASPVLVDAIGQIIAISTQPGFDGNIVDVANDILSNTNLEGEDIEIASVFSCVLEASSAFWAEYHQNNGSGDTAFLPTSWPGLIADAAGAAIGLGAGPVGSIVIGAWSSMVAEACREMIEAHN